MTKRVHRCRLGFYYLCFLGLAPLYATAQLTYTECETGIQIKEGAEKVLFYQTQAKSLDGEFLRNNYIHPLYAIDGSVITEDFPEDHPHHRGVFWAWHQVVIGDKNIGDSWECKDFIWNIKEFEISRSGENLNLMVSTYWQSPQWINPAGNQKPFLLENTKIIVHPRKENYRIVRFEITLLALEKNLKIGGSEDEKGYGGFSVRLKLPEDIGFSSIEGAVTAQNRAVEAGKWMNIFGSFTNKNTPSGIAIFSHQDSPGEKENWILREKESMQNCVYPGRNSVAVSTINPTVLKYSLLIYEGKMSGPEIQKIHKELK